MASTQRKRMNQQASLHEKQTQATTIPYCKIKMKALFPSKKEKKKYNKKRKKHVIHAHSDGKTVMFRRQTPCLTPPHKLHNISEKFTLFQLVFLQKGFEKIVIQTKCTKTTTYHHIIIHSIVLVSVVCLSLTPVANNKHT